MQRRCLKFISNLGVEGEGMIVNLVADAPAWCIINKFVEIPVIIKYDPNLKTVNFKINPGSANDPVDDFIQLVKFGKLAEQVDILGSFDLIFKPLEYQIFKIAEKIRR